MPSDDELVFVRPRSRGDSSEWCYHTDPDCHRLALAETSYEKPVSVLPDDATECSYCSGEHTPSAAANPHSLRDTLLDMDPDDIGSGTAEGDG